MKMIIKMFYYEGIQIYFYFFNIEITIIIKDNFKYKCYIISFDFKIQK